MLYRHSGAVFRTLNRLLNGRNCFFEIDNDALPRAARIRQPVSAIAKTVLGDLRWFAFGILSEWLVLSKWPGSVFARRALLAV